ncbi:hypothetical protein [Streptomyces sp. Root1310]|uniref:hypothetical protein n=1 Tax=Streptomyces sp. Root1310 TaxID=1736452 RepID=UPI000708BD9A|nr:hypothetical protein [Streptomyces sp. Root1310]KQX65081.1 hypothetical protein ASD48_18495 [Streptomyces sp. Root1310]
MTAQLADGGATAAGIRHELTDVIAPAPRPAPDTAAPRARTEALAAEQPLSLHLSHDGAVR